MSQHITRDRSNGRAIRFGWFRRMDRQALNLTGDVRRRRLDLLVVPPDTSAPAARRAFAARPDIEEIMVWDSEGGHLVR